MAHYYRWIGPTQVEPTEHVQGAWLPSEQHMAPVAGMLTQALESFHPRQDLQLCRLSFEILGVMPREPTEVTVEMVRPGRTIELLEATMRVAGRTVVRARGWRLSRGDSQDVAGGLPEQMPSPEDAEAWEGMDIWSGGFIDSLQFRQVPGGQPGRRRIWLRTDVTLFDSGAPSTSGLAQYVALVDSANGVAARVDPREWMFPNTDLQIHLWRTPEPGWVGLDTTATIGTDGVGLTHTVLHDEQGPVGRAAQILTVRPFPG